MLLRRVEPYAPLLSPYGAFHSGVYVGGIGVGGIGVGGVRDWAEPYVL